MCSFIFITPPAEMTSDLFSLCNIDSLQDPPLHLSKNDSCCFEVNIVNNSNVIYGTVIL